MNRLSTERISERLKELNEWSLQGDKISKRVKMKDFVTAMGFVTSVALLAEKANHHPDIDIRWNQVTLVLSTHSAGGLTDKDFDLARQIDQL